MTAEFYDASEGSTKASSLDFVPVCGRVISTVVDGRWWEATVQWSPNGQLQLPFVGIGWCELHQRASRPNAAVAKLTQIDGEPR